MNWLKRKIVNYVLNLIREYPVEAAEFLGLNDEPKVVRPQRKIKRGRYTYIVPAVYDKPAGKPAPPKGGGGVEPPKFWTPPYGYDRVVNSSSSIVRKENKETTKRWEAEKEES